jgi:hypothetical protein
MRSVSFQIVREVIPNHAPMHHRWCTRHLPQNFIKHDDIKDNFKIFEEVCQTMYLIKSSGGGVAKM